jgi:biotin transport system substrate-specific component
VPYSPVLAQRLFPRKGLLRETLVVACGAALIALLAQIRIDIWPVPVTGQTLGVLLCGALLGFRRGVAATVVYVGAGLAGLPVFAGSGTGLAVLTGTTGGYLVGFVVSAGTVGLLAEHGYLRGYARTALAMVLGTLPVFVLGVAWLLNYVEPTVALRSGLLVFLPGAAIKIALATVIAARLERAE